VIDRLRNVAILLAVAAAVMLLPGGGNASAAVLQLLVILLLGSVGWFAVRLYREHRSEIYSLGERNRGLLYAAVGLAALTLTATDRLWATGVGTLAWFALMAIASGAVYTVFRASRLY